MRQPTDEELAQIDTAFRYHPPRGAQPQQYEFIRSQARDLALQLVRNCPPSRERSTALTRLEEMVFWANASIARGGEA